MRKNWIATSAAIGLLFSQLGSADAATFSDLVNVEGVGQSQSCSNKSVYITHQGGYVAEIDLSAPVIGGVQTLLLGQCLGISGPLVYSRMKIYTHTGLVWEPKKLFVDVSLTEETKPGCALEFVISGTTLDPKFEVKHHNTFSPDHVC